MFSRFSACVSSCCTTSLKRYGGAGSSDDDKFIKKVSSRGRHSVWSRVRGFSTRLHLRAIFFSLREISKLKFLYNQIYSMSIILCMKRVYDSQFLTGARVWDLIFPVCLGWNFKIGYNINPPARQSQDTT